MQGWTLTEAFQGFHSDLRVSAHLLLHFLPGEEVEHSLGNHLQQARLHGRDLEHTQTIGLLQMIKMGEITLH